MTAHTRAQSSPIQPALRTSGRQIFLAFLALALIFAALVLVIVGLDAFNGLLARGVASLANPVS